MRQAEEVVKLFSCDSPIRSSLHTLKVFWDLESNLSKFGNIRRTYVHCPDCNKVSLIVWVDGLESPMIKKYQYVSTLEEFIDDHNEEVDRLWNEDPDAKELIKKIDLNEIKKYLQTK